MLSYCNHRGNWESGLDSILRTIMCSHADVVIFPLQDILGYGSDTRMNRPGVPYGNWGFRITKEQLDGIDLGYWKYLNGLYCRD